MANQLLTTKAYSSKDVTLSLGGVEVTGFAADSKVSVSKNDNLVNKHEGVDGDISLSIDNRTSGVMTISLTNTSPMNGYLETFAAQMTATGYASFPVVMEDPTGSSIVTIGWIETQPDYSVSSEIGEREWGIGLMDSRTQPSAAQSAALNAMQYFGLDV